MVWPAVIAAVGALANTGLNSFLSSNSAKKQSQYNQEAAALQYYYQRELNKNAYQDTTYSMRQAGINPMLAISNGASTGSVGLNSVSVNTPQSDIVTPALQAYTSAKQLKNDTKRVENETKNTEANVRKLQYDADLAHEQSALINEQNRQLMTYGDLERQQGLINSAKTADLLDAQRQDVQNQMLNRNMITSAQVSNLSALGSSALTTARANAKNADVNAQRVPVSIDLYNKLKNTPEVRNIVNSINYMRSHSAKQIYDSEVNYLLKKYRKH